MTNQDFETLVHDKVKEYAEGWGIPIDKAFVMFCVALVRGIDEEDALDAVVIGGKNDLSCDFGYIDSQQQEILLAQGKYSTTVTRDNIRGLRDLPGILRNAAEVRKLKGNDRIRLFGRKYRKHQKKGYKVRSYLFSMATLTAPLKAELRGIENYDFPQLKQKQEERATTTFARPPRQIELLLDPERFFRLRDEPNRPRCLIAYLPLRQLHVLFQEYGIGLFDDNVRLHAGNKTAANLGMVRTLAGQDAENFAFYNNGISILCSQFKVPKSGTKGPLRITLKDAQIINGAQTTFTVGSLDEDEIPKNAHVLVRVVCPPRGHPEDFKERVIRFSNTQTPVTTRDFRSNDDRQKELFRALRKWEPPYFYERKLGLWEQAESSVQAGFRRKGAKGKHPKNYRIIDNKVLAQCKLAWDGKPGTAKSSKQRIFVLVSEGGIYDEVFPENCYVDAVVKEYVTSYELYRRLTEEKAKWGKELRAAEKEGNKQEVEKLERYRFLTHFYFFAIAAVRYIQKQHCPSEERGDEFAARGLKDVGFYQLFKLLREIFARTLRAEQNALARVERVFNLNGWFKRDDNFEKTIKPAIDEDYEKVAEVVDTILKAKDVD